LLITVAPLPGLLSPERWQFPNGQVGTTVFIGTSTGGLIARSMLSAGTNGSQTFVIGFIIIPGAHVGCKLACDGFKELVERIPLLLLLVLLLFPLVFDLLFPLEVFDAPPVALDPALLWAEDDAVP
jgi:hypothetical protein